MCEEAPYQPEKKGDYRQAMENAGTWKNRRILTLDQHIGVRILVG
jgi:hypothetical protein